MTGGTGLYIRALLEGLLEAGEADEDLRAELEAEHARAAAAGDPLRLHRRLAEIDPEEARRVHPHDLRRVVRALEIAQRGTGGVSGLRRAHGFRDRPYRVLHLAIDPGREALVERIDARCRGMIDAGLLQEVRDLRERKYGPELRPMQAIGYRHMNLVADGRTTLELALESMRRDTRRFARRQRTWIRSVEGVLWFAPAEEARIFETVERFLERRAEAPEEARPTAP